MNYYYVSKLKLTRRMCRLKPLPQALFYELLTISWYKRGKTSFIYSNEKLASDLGVTEKTLQGARETLEEAGLITYQFKLGQQGMYKLVGEPVKAEIEEEDESGNNGVEESKNYEGTPVKITNYNERDNIYILLII